MSLLNRMNQGVRKEFGAILRDALDSRGIKHNYLARKLGVSPVQVFRILEGINFPSDEALHIIATELGTTADELLGRMGVYLVEHFLYENEVES